MRLFFITFCISHMVLTLHIASCFSTRFITTRVVATRTSWATTCRRFSASSSSSFSSSSNGQKIIKSKSKKNNNIRKSAIETKKSGDIDFYDEQDALKLDQDRLCRTVAGIRRLIGYDTYSVTLILVDDSEMRSINKKSRGIDSPTDILSFPFHAAIESGILEPVQFDIPDYYMLVSMW